MSYKDQAYQFNKPWLIYMTIIAQIFITGKSSWLTLYDFIAQVCCENTGLVSKLTTSFIGLGFIYTDHAFAVIKNTFLKLEVSLRRCTYRLIV